jgi:hypothetical protein
MQCRSRLIEPLEPRALMAGDLLPDLVTVADPFRQIMHGWYYGASQQWMRGKTLLRFANAVANLGQGPLETYADQIVEHPVDGQEVPVSQRVYQSGGGFVARPAGVLHFHDQGSHHHFHFEDFAEYNLRAVTAGNGVGAIVRTGGKAGFCLRDSYQYDASVPGAPGNVVYGDECYPKSGISVGWADWYGATLDFQWIDVTGLPPGQYWLESIADPENRLAESNENNNTTRIMVNLNVPRLGDANLDGHVNSTDFNILRSNFGRNFVTWSAGDFTGDRRVTFEDFQILETSFDSASPAPAPASPIRPTAGAPRRRTAFAF